MMPVPSVLSVVSDGDEPGSQDTAMLPRCSLTSVPPVPSLVEDPPAEHAERIT